MKERDIPILLYIVFVSWNLQRKKIVFEKLYFHDIYFNIGKGMKMAFKIFRVYSLIATIKSFKNILNLEDIAWSIIINTMFPLPNQQKRQGNYFSNKT